MQLWWRSFLLGKAWPLPDPTEYELMLTAQKILMKPSECESQTILPFKILFWPAVSFPAPRECNCFLMETNQSLPQFSKILRHQIESVCASSPISLLPFTAKIDNSCFITLKREKEENCIIMYSSELNQTFLCASPDLPHCRSQVLTNTEPTFAWGRVSQ